LVTSRQQTAIKLVQQGLTQKQAGHVMGICRESVNRLLARANERIECLRKLCIDQGQCRLMEILAK
jgi:predicted DNA-binding protein (UPF0251 family)